MSPISMKVLKGVLMDEMGKGQGLQMYWKGQTKVNPDCLFYTGEILLSPMMIEP